MKRLLLMIPVILLLMSAGAYADVASKVYVFTPSDPDLADLSHDTYYKWGLEWVLPANEEILSATLTYKQIWDTEHNVKDHLATHLLNTVNDPNSPTQNPNWTSALTPSGSSYKRITIVGYDANNSNDQFVETPGQDVRIDFWQTPNGGNSSAKADRVIDLTLRSDWLTCRDWLSDGKFGFGIDPDCHYDNCGIEFKICTVPKETLVTVPEPFSIMLSMMGLGAVAGYRRLRH